ncbi:alkaline phosphatase [Azospirillum thermophilum]|uniref:Alkaline phosphatase n=1 Tax=Azospirillum thermophilum TaxID=2202148 RepID=A0A2S2CVE5_9PROT|nr:alkaline phosphatase [Azospirillum thermophilum]AWK88350.1 alkaline phosphatase [Azospirillum thermophilum]
MTCRTPRTLLAAACSLGILAGGPAVAQTIYPVDRADVLIGQKFDFKVEFPGIADPAKVKVTINGKDHAAVLGKAARFIERESGVDASALLLRDVAIERPGTYTVTATDGTSSSSVTWTVYATGPRKVKNVVLMIGDGMGIAHRTAARIMSKGIKEGKYHGKLAIDDMPRMALIGTSGVDAIVTDSANSASAYTSGHKSSNNAVGVYVDRTPDHFDDPRVEYIGEFVKRRKNMAVGVVTNAEIYDATPAAMGAHTAKRTENQAIVDMLYALKPEVMMGGGSPYFLPQSNPLSKRTDDRDYVAQAAADGYRVTRTAQEMMAAAHDPRTRKLFGLYNTRFLDGYLDREILKPSYVLPNQPDLPDMARAALEVLSRHPNGFVLMIESALTDKYTHQLDTERAVYDTIMLDKTAEVVKEFATRRGDTLVIITPDHTHSISLVGTVNDDAPGPDMREKVGVYQHAGFPNYVDANGDGYPDRPDVSRRLFMTLGIYPDHYETWRPKTEGIFFPTVKDKDGNYVANEAYRAVPGAVLVQGNMPRSESNGVHAADDVLLTAMGPGSERIHGFMDNTDVFRVMAEALGLGHRPKKR